jgi:predicted DNA binding CopG/RHH family protein
MHTATGSSTVAGTPSAIGPSSAGEPPLADRSFAGLLAGMAAAPQSPEFSWNDSLLAEDVASISYDQVLRTHARVQPPSRNDIAANAARKSEPAESQKALKKASITIRLSEPECEQLRQRAAEAGLTVSAYLRSCTLEVESLRAQVKQTLAQMRGAPLTRAESEIAPRPEHSVRSFLARLREWARNLLGKRCPALRLNPANPFAPLP